MGRPSIYQFSIRGATVRGVYCTWCNDATTLAFVDGKFGAAGITFTVTHVDNNGKTTHTDTGTAIFEKPNLIVTGKLGGRQGGNFRWVMVKDERGPDPLPIPIVMLPPRDVPILGRGGAGAPRGGAVHRRFRRRRVLQTMRHQEVVRLRPRLQRAAVAVAEEVAISLPARG